MDDKVQLWKLGFHAIRSQFDNNLFSFYFLGLGLGVLGAPNVSPGLDAGLVVGLGIEGLLLLIFYYLLLNSFH